jgi:hypothetical protein
VASNFNPSFDSEHELELKTLKPSKADDATHTKLWVTFAMHEPRSVLSINACSVQYDCSSPTARYESTVPVAGSLQKNRPTLFEVAVVVSVEVWELGIELDADVVRVLVNVVPCVVVSEVVAEVAMELVMELVAELDTVVETVPVAVVVAVVESVAVKVCVEVAVVEAEL